MINPNVKFKLTDSSTTQTEVVNFKTWFSATMSNFHKLLPKGIVKIADTKSHINLTRVILCNNVINELN